MHGKSLVVMRERRGEILRHRKIRDALYSSLINRISTLIFHTLAKPVTRLSQFCPLLPYALEYGIGSFIRGCCWRWADTHVSMTIYRHLLRRMNIR